MSRTENCLEPEEDGNIFVCFLCEREFKKVSALNKHMEEHENVPELFDTLPRERARLKKNTRVLTAMFASDDTDDTDDTDDKSSLETLKAVAPSHTPPESPKKQKPPEEKQKWISPVNSTASKGSASPEELAMKRAMKLKNLIMSREIKQELLMEEKANNLENNDDEENRHEGPYILNGDPDSFRVIHPVSVKKDVPAEPVLEALLKPDGFTPQFQIRPKRGRGRPRKYHPIEKPVPEEFEDSVEPDEPITLNEKMQRKATRVYPTHIEKHSAKVYPTKRRETAYDYANMSSTMSSDSTQCLECGKHFLTTSSLKTHVKSHSVDKELPCNFCGMVFPQRYLLHDHLANQHGTAADITCEICYKVFTRPDSLRVHMMRLHEKGGLSCYICSKTFPSHAQLETHIRVHTGERPFKCNVCSRGFVQKIHLQTHLQKMHDSNKSKTQCTTPCRVCGQMFPGRIALRDHCKYIHNLSAEAYKAHVKAMRKEGRIPETLPQAVKIVDPNFRYTKVNVTDIESKMLSVKRRSFPNLELHPMMAGVAKPTNLQVRDFHTTGTSVKADPPPRGPKEKHLTTTFFSKKGAKRLKLKAVAGNNRYQGMGTIMDVSFFDDSFDPFEDSSNAQSTEGLSADEGSDKEGSQEDSDVINSTDSTDPLTLTEEGEDEHQAVRSTTCNTSDSDMLMVRNARKAARENSLKSLGSKLPNKVKVEKRDDTREARDISPGGLDGKDVSDIVDERLGQLFSTGSVSDFERETTVPISDM